MNGQITFFKTITGADESSNYVAQTTDGGYVIAGASTDTSGNINGLVIKTNALGDTTWTRIYGIDTRFNSGMQTSDGGYILIGKKQNFPTGDYDIYILKIDAAGIIQWQKTIGLSDNEYGTSIRQTADGGYVLAGHGSDLGTGYAIYVVKLDPGGNLQWDKVIGGSDTKTSSSIRETNDGGYIITGASSNGTDSETYLLKLDGSGVEQWSKKYGGTTYAKGSCIQQTPDQGYVISGTRTNSAGSSSDLSVMKTDSLGNIDWAKVYVGANPYLEGTINKTSNGNYILSSSKNVFGQSKLLFTLIDNSGNELWSRYMGITDLGFGSWAEQTADGGFVFTGYSITLALRGAIYFIKADSLGRSGCDSSTTLTVTPFIPTVTTPTSLSISGLAIINAALLASVRSDTINTYCTTVAISELQSKDQIAVYPNPSSGQFNFSGLRKESKIEVFDITGRTVYQLIAVGDLETINISDKAKGIYFYRVTSEMKLVQNGKICME
ncbi:MAG: T9SS type A sorting domain-containing protein [Bacteroidetes bacterium]|nr:T9SS type A sorting domain-containing protein [Bacteroidota bacterium]